MLVRHLKLPKNVKMTNMWHPSDTKSHFYTVLTFLLKNIFVEFSVKFSRFPQFHFFIRASLGMFEKEVRATCPTMHEWRNVMASFFMTFRKQQNLHRTGFFWRDGVSIFLFKHVSEEVRLKITCVMTWHGSMSTRDCVFFTFHFSFCVFFEAHTTPYHHYS